MNDYLDDPKNKPADSTADLASFQAIAARLQTAQRAYTPEAFNQHLPRLLFIEFLNAFKTLKSPEKMERAAEAVGESPAYQRALVQNAIDDVERVAEAAKGALEGKGALPPLTLELFGQLKGLMGSAAELALASRRPFADFDDYQEKAKRTLPQAAKDATAAGDPREQLDLGAYNLWEAGEIGNIIKKVVKHGHDLDSVNKSDPKGRTYRACLFDEIGDVLWALAIIADGIGMKLGGSAHMNVVKLLARYPDGFSSEASINRKA